MYLHLGKNTVVKQAEVLAVCDLDNASYSHITREYLSRAEKAGEVINISDDLPKSFVVCAGPGGGKQLYLSQLASATLLKRAETDSFLNE